MTIARNAVQSISRGWLATTSPRLRQRIPASQAFWICTRAYSRTGRDVLAAYRKPIAPSARPVVPGASNVDEPLPDEVFRTASTSPAGSSMQEIPPPSELQGGSRLETPIPAMKAPEEVLPSKRKLEPSQSRKEIIVQGVPIPPKPIAPGEEGEWLFSLSEAHMRSCSLFGRVADGPRSDERRMLTQCRVLHVGMRALRVYDLRGRSRALHRLFVLRT